ncbi:MAG: malto-oligosyltrehalose trehalohydrolase [Syntrophales bacterium]
MRGAFSRRLPIGAELIEGGGVHFRVWAPQRRTVEVWLEGGTGAPAVIELTAEKDGYFSGSAAGAGEGTLYRFRLDREDIRYPDPASRFQPGGVHGPSCVVDPRSFKWTDSEWSGVSIENQIIYEMHVGTFTREGTWQSARRELAELAAAGITVIEVMPVAEFPGSFGWGYDGVDLFSPTRLYGEPDDFRAFVDAAHNLGLGVILDVVYNHLGPEGNYLKQFSENYFTDRYVCEWGEAINFDGTNSGPVREFFISNAEYWIDEYHLDGFRLDATSMIFDASSDHILAALTRRARQKAAGRKIIVIAENDAQQSRYARPPEAGGYGLDGLWNDDFHHAAMVALTGRDEAYYADFRGTPQEFISAVKWGYLYQGQYNKWQKKRRGSPSFSVKPAAFVTYLQNHDQIANSGRGLRYHLLSSPGNIRAMTALLLLGPGTPLLFQGQEFAASSPFLFFSDLKKDLAALARKGRREFLARFRNLADPEVQSRMDDPSDPATFRKCILDFDERIRHKEVYALYRDLIRLRREDPVLKHRVAGNIDGAVLSPQAFVIRFFGSEGNDRLLFVNLGGNLHLSPAPEPLLAPPESRHWGILWSSESPLYGGSGTPPLETEEEWLIPGQAAVLLAPGDDGKTRE